MAVLSVAKTPAVPSEAYYPVDRLWLFERHTRATWRERFGEEPPKWDSSRRIKRWADTSVYDSEQLTARKFHYFVFDGATGKFDSIELDWSEAATPNLPGQYVYPKWAPAPTPAVLLGPNGAESPVNPEIICLKAEAEALAREIGQGVVIESNAFTMGPYLIDWRSEERRLWNIKIGASMHSAARLLASKYALGVGAPGEWKMEGEQPVWMLHRIETPEMDPRPEIPMPVRRLTDIERLYSDPFQTVIYRIDMESPYNKLIAGGGAGPGGSGEELKILRRVDQNVAQLLALSIK